MCEVRSAENFMPSFLEGWKPPSKWTVCATIFGIKTLQDIEISWRSSKLRVLSVQDMFFMSAHHNLLYVFALTKLSCTQIGTQHLVPLILHCSLLFQFLPYSKMNKLVNCKNIWKDVHVFQQTRNLFSCILVCELKSEACSWPCCYILQILNLRMTQEEPRLR